MTTRAPASPSLLSASIDIDGGVRFVERRRDDHALAGCEPVGLDHDRRAFRVEIRVRGGGVGERLVLGRRNAVALHERLGEVLRAFELRRFLRRPEDLQAARRNRLTMPAASGAFGPTTVSATCSFSAKSASAASSVMATLRRRLVLRCAAVARRDVDDLHARRLRELPGERVFAAAGTDDE